MKLDGVFFKTLIFQPFQIHSMISITLKMKMIAVCTQQKYEKTIINDIEHKAMIFVCLSVCLCVCALISEMAYS